MRTWELDHNGLVVCTTAIVCKDLYYWKEFFLFLFQIFSQSSSFSMFSKYKNLCQFV